MKKVENKVDRILLVIALIFILGGFCIFLYPNVSNYFAEKNQVEAIREYENLIVNIDQKELEQEWQKAQTYNENLSGDPVHDPFVEESGYALPENYKEVLNISNEGEMAYIEIPKISVYLPIYHGTSSEVLEKGVGHIESTSVPIGGESTHSVLTGHTGLPSAELFTRLDELVVGDIFYIHVLDEILTYKIYETKVILPDKIDELQITNGKDLVTLVTCTPYGVNSHRLLVKAERTDYEEYVENNASNGANLNGNSESTDKAPNYYATGIKIGIAIFVVIAIAIFVFVIIIKKRKPKENE